MNYSKEHDTILKIEHVGKDYILGAVTGDTFKDAIKKRHNKISESEMTNRKFVALDDVSFEVKRGEAIGLIGSNGAGKSTLLKLISRITAPTRGNIYIGGKVASMLEVGTGFHPELTGRENIYLNGSILGMSRAEIDEKIESIIDFSEVREFIDTPVKRYSSGMYVKLAFSVASHLDSDIMIMDEVLAVGDQKFQTKCLNMMRDIAEKDGRTILYVSHNMDTVRKLCGRCIMLDHGHLVYDGDVEGAIKLYAGTEIKTDHNADYTEYVRPGWLTRDDARITTVEYPGRNDNIVTDGRLDISINWHDNAAVDGMGIRVEMLDSDEKAFATGIFYNLFSGEAGQEGSATVSLNLAGIMPGTYQTIYTLFCMGTLGESIDLDNVRGIDITVEKQFDEQELRWRNDSWGNIKL